VPGDELAIRLFVGGAALTLAGLGTTQAGWTHRSFVVGLFLGAAVLAAIAIFWAPIAATWPKLDAALSAISVSPVAWFWLLVGGLGCIFVADLGARYGWFSSKRRYTETHIRFEREPGSVINFRSVKEHEKNIYTWKQLYNHIEFKNGATGKPLVVHADAFFIIFQKPTQYQRPILNAFGHPLPPYDFYLMSDKGFLLGFNNTFTAPTFEINFPMP
jgi:hypothetical protein